MIPSRIEAHLYRLFPLARMGSKGGSHAREGALLRVDFGQGKAGYADCFPWPELGDLPLSEQLRLVGRGDLTPLTRRSLEFARQDAEARSEGRSLFADRSVSALPRNHWLFTDISRLSAQELIHISSLGFREIKLKVGRCPESEAALLREHAPMLREYNLKLRLDFNASLTPQGFEDFLEALGPALERIDFIEDPTPYRPAEWRGFQKKWKVRLALDRFVEGCGIEPGTFSVLIVKPALQDPQEMLRIAREFHASVVVTSYLGHPLEQLSAAWCAAQILASEPDLLESCGLLSQVVYQPHSFSEQIRMKDGVLIPPPRTGFGMDHLLSALAFRPLDYL